MATVKVINASCIHHINDSQDAIKGVYNFIDYLKEQHSSITYTIQFPTSETSDIDLLMTANTINNKVYKTYAIELKSRYKNYGDILIDKNKIDKLNNFKQDNDRNPLLITLYPNDNKLFILNLTDIDVYNTYKPIKREMPLSTSSKLTKEHNGKTKVEKYMYTIPQEHCKSFTFNFQQ